jgi:hypothetical protein
MRCESLGPMVGEDPLAAWKVRELGSEPFVEKMRGGNGERWGKGDECE